MANILDQLGVFPAQEELERLRQLQAKVLAAPSSSNSTERPEQLENVSPDISAMAPSTEDSFEPKDMFHKEKAVLSAREQLPEVPFRDDDLDAAQKRSDMLAALMMMSKGAEKVGSSIAGVKSDVNYLDSMKPFIGKPVEDILTKRRAEAAKMELDMQKFNFARLKDADDPSGIASKFARDSLNDLSKQVGIQLNIPENISAAELDRRFPTLMNIISAKMAQNARLDAAKLKAEEKKEGKAEKQSEAQKKFTRDLRKEATQGQYGKLYANVNHSQKASGAINQFIKDPTGYSDYATLMTSLKSLQGDDSVVREAEMRLGIQAGSFKEQVMNQFDKLRSGKSLQPAQRQNILRSVDILKDITERQYLEGIAPILNQAEEQNIDPKLILPGNIGKKKEVPSDTVVVRRKSDGAMKRVSASDAKKILTDPGYEKVQ